MAHPFQALDHESQIQVKNEALLTSVHLELLVQLLDSPALSLHKDYIFDSLFSIKYSYISPHHLQFST